MALWSGRFTEGADAFTQRFGASLPVDQKMYAQDIAGSKAHGAMLAAQGIIGEEDAAAIACGLDGILADIEAGALAFDVQESEDVHMAIEAELTARIGDAGARLHTGRSRNDQVATDTRLYAKQRATDLMAANVALREALIAQAEAHFDVILPGYTHLQHAQPVLFSLDLIYACSVSCLHLSRLCEEIILWSTAEFGFITLSDAYSTGSSIMPQKKNPDFAELIRGKSGRVVGDLMALMMTLKSLPLAYNTDLQEDKEGAMDAADTLEDCYVCAAGMIATMTVHPEAMMAQAQKGYLAATDVADYLAKKGLPFRRAHEVVGHLVLKCEQRGCDLEDLALADFQAESDLFEADIASCLNLEAIVAARTTYGGTGHAAVREQLTEVKASLAADHTRL